MVVTEARPSVVRWLICEGTRKDGSGKPCKTVLGQVYEQQLRGPVLAIKCDKCDHTTEFR